MKATEQEFKNGKYQDKENGLVLDKGTIIDTKQFGETVEVQINKHKENNMAEAHVLQVKVESKQLVELIESFNKAMQEMQDRIEVLEKAQR